MDSEVFGWLILNKVIQCAEVSIEAGVEGVAHLNL